MLVHHLRCWAGFEPTEHTGHSVSPIVIPSKSSTQPTLLTPCIGKMLVHHLQKLGRRQTNYSCMRQFWHNHYTICIWPTFVNGWHDLFCLAIGARRRLNTGSQFTNLSFVYISCITPTRLRAQDDLKRNLLNVCPSSPQLSNGQCLNNG